MEGINEKRRNKERNKTKWKEKTMEGKVKERNK
jgi:hypothetical protein